MKFITSFYRTEKGKTALILQQAQRRDGISVLFAAVSGGENGEKFAVRLTDWFYSVALPACRRTSAVNCVDRVEKRLTEALSGDFQTESAAVLFAVDGECVIAWKGNSDVRFFQQCFDRNTGQTLTWYAEEMTYRRLIVQEGVGILLGNSEYFEHVDNRKLDLCLPGKGLTKEKQAARHLAETAQEAERHGAKDVGAVLLVTVE